MASTMKTIKGLYNAFYNKEGALRETPVGSLERKNLPENNIAFLRAFTAFIVDSAILNRAGRIYIADPRDSIKGIFAAYSKENPDSPITLKAANNALDYCRRKICNSFDADMLLQIMEHPNNADMGRYWEQLQQAQLKYSKGGKLFSTIIGLKIVGTMSDVVPPLRDIQAFADCLYAYRPSAVEDAQKEVDCYQDVAAYFNWLSGKQPLTECERDLLDSLVRYLAGEADEVVDRNAGIREYELPPGFFREEDLDAWLDGKL